MIDKKEILEAARIAKLNPHIVEKDYVLGWMLAGIYQNKTLFDNWVFKGGTCLKKCYFESYRMSEDLDFTLKDTVHLDKEFLETTFSQISKWILKNSGIRIPEERMEFEFYENPRGKLCCEGKIFYNGPIAPTSPRQVPRIKIDLTADEYIVEPSALNKVKHGYSDVLSGKISVPCYSYVELFAEKIRALSDRTRPRDLYDVIHLYRSKESKGLAPDVKRVMALKCDFKNIAIPTFKLLTEQKDICGSGWVDQLSYQVSVLPSFDSYWDELPNFFDWLDGDVK